MIISDEDAREFLAAAEALRRGIALAAHVMTDCENCNRKGRAAAEQVWKALDLYEPAVIRFKRALRSRDQ